MQTGGRVFELHWTAFWQVFVVIYVSLWHSLWNFIVVLGDAICWKHVTMNVALSNFIDKTFFAQLNFVNIMSAWMTFMFASIVIVCFVGYCFKEACLTSCASLKLSLKRWHLSRFGVYFSRVSVTFSFWTLTVCLLSDFILCSLHYCSIETAMNALRY